MKMQQAGELDEVKVQLSAIIAEGPIVRPLDKQGTTIVPVRGLCLAAMVYPDGHFGSRQA